MVIALDKQYRLTTWNVASGKLLFRKLISNVDEIKDYSVFSPDVGNNKIYMGKWYQNNVVLINNSKALEGIDR